LRGGGSIVNTASIDGFVGRGVRAAYGASKAGVVLPMPRLCEPEDVANAVLFLASDEAGFVNGTTLMVEGGATIYMPSVGFAGGREGAA
jgi:NAD(P)-dependent dehydrogenase (short-subunit alcohol dehydrogenase family)